MAASVIAFVPKDVLTVRPVTGLFGRLSGNAAQEKHAVCRKGWESRFQSASSERKKVKDS
jgi:hypothetical protein